MFCYNCGAQIDDDALFCHACGAAVGNQETAEPTETVEEPVWEPIDEPATELLSVPAEETVSEPTEKPVEEEPDFVSDIAAPAPVSEEKQTTKKKLGLIIALCATGVGVIIVIIAAIILFSSLNHPFAKIGKAFKNNVEESFEFEITLEGFYGVSEERTVADGAFSAGKDDKIEAVIYADGEIVYLNGSYMMTCSSQYTYGEITRREEDEDMQELAQIMLERDYEELAEYINDMAEEDIFEPEEFAIRVEEILDDLMDKGYLEENFGLYEENGKNGEDIIGFKFKIKSLLKLVKDIVKESKSAFEEREVYNSVIDELDSIIEFSDSVNYNLVIEFTIDGGYLTSIEITVKDKSVTSNGTGSGNNAKIEISFRDFGEAKIDSEVRDVYRSHKEKMNGTYYEWDDRYYYW